MKCSYINDYCPYSDLMFGGCINPGSCPEVQGKESREELDYPEDIMFTDEDFEEEIEYYELDKEII